MLAATAEHFLDMAMQIIAQQITMILYGTIMKALGIGGLWFWRFSSVNYGTSTNYFGGGFDAMSFFADGGFVSRSY